MMMMMIIIVIIIIILGDSHSGPIRVFQAERTAQVSFCCFVCFNCLLVPLFGTARPAWIDDSLPCLPDSLSSMAGLADTVVPAEQKAV